ncbi:MAG: hypothetical protein RDU13_11505 [Elusimicrobiales bacterium]|nr:hypothetical protein [Elusimicrobiales bacterium]
MGYFEGVGSMYFKKDPQGRAVFYPWGALGKGYVLSDETMEPRLRRFLKTYIILVVPVFAVAAAFGLGWIIAFTAVSIAWFHLAAKRMLSGCAVSGERLTLRESYSNAARSHNRATLWVLLLVSLFFAVSAFYLAYLRRPSGLSALLILSGLFFGGLSAAYIYMIKVRRDT